MPCTYLTGPVSLMLSCHPPNKQGQALRPLLTASGAAGPVRHVTVGCWARAVARAGPGGRGRGAGRAVCDDVLLRTGREGDVGLRAYIRVCTYMHMHTRLYASHMFIMCVGMSAGVHASVCVCCARTRECACVCIVPMFSCTKPVHR